MASNQRRQNPARKKYATKPIQFLGRTTPIILQRDDGSSPLVAICNVLLLRNELNLNIDNYSLSKKTLLSLLVKLLESKDLPNDDENQHHNILEAIDLLPRLSTGVDVNIKFRRIDDFEFTHECAIFALLDIPLYHGLIVDPLDFDTCRAIRDKSYNALMEELAALETRNIEAEFKRNFEDTSFDFGDYQIIRKGDVEEEEQLARVLKLSKVEFRSSPVGTSEKPSTSRHTENIVETIEGHTGDGNQNLHRPKSNVSAHCNASSVVNIASFETISFDELSLFSLSDEGNRANQPSSADLAGPLHNSIGIDDTDSYVLVTKDCECDDVSQMATVDTLGEISSLSPPDANADADSSSGKSHHELDDNMFEEDECTSDYGITDYESRKAMYEHNRADEDTLDELTPYQGALIRNFLKMNESQLSVYGLFCLQEGLKERELCVFFRNNQFSTMFKYGGELYLLVTKEGYTYGSEVVWEKLHPVNGNTLSVNGDFNTWWDEYNVFTSTSDYLTTINNSANPASDFNSDFELAIALQQEEFEEHPWSQNVVQPSSSRINY